MNINDLQDKLDNVNAVGAHNVTHAGHMMGLRLIPGAGKAKATGDVWMTGFRDEGGIVWLGYNNKDREFVMEYEHDGPEHFDLVAALEGIQPDVAIGTMAGYLMGLVVAGTISANELKKLAFRMEKETENLHTLKIK